MKIKITQSNLTEKQHLQKEDASSLSTETIAPLIQHRMTDTTFVSSVDIGSVNLSRVHFHLMFTLFLLSNKVHNLLIIQSNVLFVTFIINAGIFTPVGML